jgi:hypothetical protein
MILKKQGFCLQSLSMETTRPAETSVSFYQKAASLRRTHIYLKKKSRVMYRGGDPCVARATWRCSLFDGVNISFDASLVIYMNSTNIPPIMIINSAYEHQNLQSL